MDVICQAKSGMGKTAVFVLSTLQQIEPVAGQVAALILCHTRELAYQACQMIVIVDKWPMKMLQHPKSFFFICIYLNVGIFSCIFHTVFLFPNNVLVFLTSTDLS